jgi:lipopolysaccharide/colanic/teichoic acid biosynthesis glycosyltransferase
VGQIPDDSTRPLRWTPLRKQIFDGFVIGSLALALAPVLAICVLAIWALDGSPIFYFSKRRVYRRHSIWVVKFRTMRCDAERIVNRDTVPVTSTRFLNLSIDSPLYTPVGRWIERLMLTELPQLYHVLLGQMSLVGNRPLPENVIASLAEAYPQVEERFDVAAGLTGPIQLVGRDHISDADRLRLEIAYCRAVAKSYSIWLDLRILFYTVLVGFMPQYRFTPKQVLRLISRGARSPQVGIGSLQPHGLRRTKSFDRDATRR